MHFHRLGSQNDRRRRLLTEEATVSADGSSSVGSGPLHPAQRFHDAAQLDQQARVTDFIPTRKRVLLALFTLGLVFIGALETGYALVTGSAGAPRLSILDLAGPSSLANWFGSILLLKTGVTALVIFALRRHRLDDYGGRYRLWLWAACAWFVMSIDEVTGLHDDFQSVMALLTKWRGPESGYVWWLGTWAVVLAVLLVRLWFEMRRCLPAILALSTALILWCIPLALRLGWSPTLGFPIIMLAVGAKLLGHLFLWLTTSIYARHVIFDVEGKLPVREIKVKVSGAAKKKAAKADREENEGEESVGEESSPSATRDKKIHVDPPHTTSSSFGGTKRSDLGPHIAPAVAARTSTSVPASHTKTIGSSLPPTASNDDDEDDADDEDGGNRRLSRAERRKLRRQQKESPR